MPKLKLSGRKLCTTGRKLAVCGCGATPCCENAGNCRYVNAATTGRRKTWFSFNYSTVLIGNTEADKFPVSGSCEGVYETTFPDTTQDSAGLIKPCRNAIFTSSYGTTNCTIPSGTTGSISASVSGNSGYFGGGAGGSQTATALIDFQISAGLFRAGNVNISAGFGFAPLRFGFSAGVPVYTLSPSGWNGTVSVTPIMDVSCIVGVRVDFNVSRPGGQSTTTTVSGYVVTAICDKFVGCNGTGIACGATPPGGGASLLENLDDALFS